MYQFSQAGFKVTGIAPGFTTESQRTHRELLIGLNLSFSLPQIAFQTPLPKP
jgi:hypothetical protein